MKRARKCPEIQAAAMERERERERAFGLYYFFDGMVYTTVVDGIIRYYRISVIIRPNHRERED